MRTGKKNYEKLVAISLQSPLAMVGLCILLEKEVVLKKALQHGAKECL